MTRYFYEDDYFADRLTNEIYPDSSDTDPTGTDQVKKSYHLDGALSQRIDQRGTTQAMNYDHRRMLDRIMQLLANGS